MAIFYKKFGKMSPSGGEDNVNFGTLWRGRQPKDSAVGSTAQKAR